MPPNPQHYVAQQSECTPQRTLIRFATLLGAISTEGHEMISELNEEGESSSKKGLFSEISSKALGSLLVESGHETCSFPCLSLGASGEGCRVLDRGGVEQTAASYLSRPILAGDDSAGVEIGAKFENPNSVGRDVCDFFSTCNLPEVPEKLVNNLCSSFVLLVDARLRAYCGVLIGHLEALFDSATAVGEKPSSDLLLRSSALKKLLGLLEIGEHVVIDAAVTTFHVITDSADDCSGSEGGLGDDEGKVVSMPLFFEAIMDVHVPHLPNASHLRSSPLTVSMRAPGSITGRFADGSNALLKAVKVTLDTHALLSSIVDQARLVVLQAVRNVSFPAQNPTQIKPITQDAQPDTPSNDSPNTMPPPQPRTPTHHTTNSTGKRQIHLLSNTSLTPLNQPHESSPNAQVSVVSPQITSIFTPSLPPPLKSKLQNNDCVTLVDFLIGEIDYDILCPQHKKPKIEMNINPIHSFSNEHSHAHIVAN